MIQLFWSNEVLHPWLCMGREFIKGAELSDEAAGEREVEAKPSDVAGGDCETAGLRHSTRVRRPTVVLGQSMRISRSIVFGLLEFFLLLLKS